VLLQSIFIIYLSLVLFIFFEHEIANPWQDESINLPVSVDQLLADYAKRFHEIKTPRKLLWKKNLGVVKVSQFSQQFLLICQILLLTWTFVLILSFLCILVWCLVLAGVTI